MGASHRTLRPAARPNVGAVTIRETQRKAAKMMRDAKRAAAATEKTLERKVAHLNTLLPHGFTPAMNPDLLPDAIRAKSLMTAEEALDAINFEDKFLPTPAQRQMVYDACQWGAPLSDIRLRIVSPITGRPITAAQLRSHFAEEIAFGQADGNVKIASGAFHTALGRPAEFDDDGNKIRAETPPNPALLIWLTKVRLQYGDIRTVNVNHTNAIDPETVEALKQLSDDELRTLRRFARKRADEKAEGGSARN